MKIRKKDFKEFKNRFLETEFEKWYQAVYFLDLFFLLSSFCKCIINQYCKCFQLPKIGLGLAGSIESTGAIILPFLPWMQHCCIGSDSLWWRQKEWSSASWDRYYKQIPPGSVSAAAVTVDDNDDVGWMMMTILWRMDDYYLEMMMTTMMILWQMMWQVLCRRRNNSSSSNVEVILDE